MRPSHHLPLLLLLLGFATAVSPLFALPVTRDSLNNGLVIITFEDHRLPIVDLALVCRSGAALEPLPKAGTASLCAQMLLRGTKTLTADSLTALLDFLGASYSADADFDHSLVQFRLLSKDLGTGLDILADIVFNPAFPEPEFRLVREELLTAARRAWDNPGSLVTLEFDRLLFGDHRYRLPARGDTGTIPKITIADLRQFYSAHFVPNNCFIVAVGDISPEVLKQEITRRFAGWQPGPVPAPEPPALRPPEKLRVKLITRPDMNQTYIQFGHSGISVRDPDLIPVRLMSYILGGPPLSSRLGLAVREYAGLAYDVRCWFDRRLLTGAFRATVQTSKPQIAIEKMFAEIDRMARTGATPPELQKAKNYFTGSFPLTYSANSGKLDQLISFELYGYGMDWFTRFPELVRTTTLEQINTAARNRLSPGRYLIVILGNITRDQLNLPNAEWIE
ncbi:MAG: pitrilysin family protein [candidate division WOR-3 bacterium]